jgi:hypothetical protein
MDDVRARVGLRGNKKTAAKLARLRPLGDRGRGPTRTSTVLVANAHIRTVCATELSGLERSGLIAHAILNVEETVVGSS